MPPESSDVSSSGKFTAKIVSRQPTNCSFCSSLHCLSSATIDFSVTSFVHSVCFSLLSCFQLKPAPSSLKKNRKALVWYRHFCCWPLFVEFFIYYCFWFFLSFILFCWFILYYTCDIIFTILTTVFIESDFCSAFVVKQYFNEIQVLGFPESQVLRFNSHNCSRRPVTTSILPFYHFGKDAF